jgi:hypothetical protein
MRTYAILFIILLCGQVTQAQKGITFVDKPESKKVEVRYHGNLLTAYCYFDSTEKPVLFPIKTLSGITVTRGYPIAPRAGERVDHPHHVGLWMNYESVNGLDFWNNSDAIPAERKHLYGSIRHQQILYMKSRSNTGTLKTSSHWVDQKGNVLLEELTEFMFSVQGDAFIIDRRSTLKAVADEVMFKDIKDGMLGIRVARELELPSQQEDKFVDAQGNVTSVAKVSSEGVTGMYRNKEGLEGDKVWGKRSEWAYLTGQKQGETVSIAILDHPRNEGYPTYWHARGYGLFAANPLGQKIFSEGKEELNLKLTKDQTTTFRYRIVIHSKSGLNSGKLEGWKKDFYTKIP